MSEPKEVVVTELSSELRAYLEEIRGDVREWRDEMAGKFEGLLGAQKTTADEVTSLKQRMSNVEADQRRMRDDLVAARRSVSESSASFDASTTGLARILASQNEVADARFQRLEKALRDESRLQMLAVAVVVVAGILLLAGRIDFPQFMVVTGGVGGGTPVLLKHMQRKRAEAEKKQ